MNASRRPPREVSSGKSFLGLAATILFLIAFAGFLLWRSKREAASEETLLRADSAPKTRASASSAKSASSAQPRRLTYSPTDNDEDVARKRLERSRHTLEGYKLWARYPPSSRPLSEMPDLQKPHSVQPSTQPLATDKGGVTQKE
jgi:cbb3-type cytochrome oxidase subunit 3